MSNVLDVNLLREFLNVLRYAVLSGRQSMPTDKGGIIWRAIEYRLG